MAVIKFANGVSVNFNGNPTPQDVEEVAKKLNIQPNKKLDSTPPKPSNLEDSIKNQPLFKGNGLLAKAGNFLASGSIPKALSNFTGVQEGLVNNLTTAGEGLAYGASKLLSKIPGQIGKTQAAAAENILNKPLSPGLKSAQQQGTAAGLKNVGGNALSGGIKLSALASGGATKSATLTGELATKFPTLAKYMNYGKTGAIFGGTLAAGNALEKNKNNKDLFGDVIKGTVTGAVTNIAIPAAFELTARAAKNISTMFNGVSAETIQNAFDNPEKTISAIKEYANNPQAKQDLLKKAEDSFDSIVSERNDTYNSAMKEIQNKTIQNSKGEIFYDGKKVNLDLSGVMDNFKKIFNSNKIKTSVSDNGLSLDFSRTPIPTSQQKNINDLVERINKWDDATPEGLNDLRQIIGSYYEVGGNNQYNQIVTRLKSGLTDYSNSNFSELETLNSNYSEASDFIGQLKKEIFGKSDISPTTKISRLMGVIKPGNPYRTKLIETLGAQSGTDLINAIQGAALSEWLPKNKVASLLAEGLGAGEALLNPLSIPHLLAPAIGVAAMSSPRVVGTAAASLGKLAQTKLNPLVSSAVNQASNKLLKR